MKRFSKRSDVSPLDPDALEDDEDTLEDELEDALGESDGLPRTNGKPPGGERWRHAIRELLAFLQVIKSRVKTPRDSAFYEMGLRAAHVKQALAVQEPDRARSHAQAIARAAAKLGHKFTGPIQTKTLRGLAKTQREAWLFELGFSASLFEEAVAQMRLAEAETMVDRIVDLAEKLGGK